VCFFKVGISYELWKAEFASDDDKIALTSDDGTIDVTLTVGSDTLSGKNNLH
jgi:hypothetical protein